MGAGVARTTQISLRDLYYEYAKAPVTELLTVLIKDAHRIKAQGDDALIEDGSSCFRLILDMAINGQKDEIIGYRVALALRAIGADPNHAGYIREPGLKPRLRTSALKWLADPAFKSDYFLNILMILDREPRALPLSLLSQIAYDALRAQIYLTIQNFEQHQDTTSQEKAALLRSSMRALDECYNSKTSSQHNFAILAEALENESSSLVIALKKQRVMRTGFFQATNTFFKGMLNSITLGAGSIYTASYDAIMQFKNQLQETYMASEVFSRIAAPFAGRSSLATVLTRSQSETAGSDEADIEVAVIFGVAK